MRKENPKKLIKNIIKKAIFEITKLLAKKEKTHFHDENFISPPSEIAVDTMISDEADKSICQTTQLFLKYQIFRNKLQLILFLRIIRCGKNIIQFFLL